MTSAQASTDSDRLDLKQLLGILTEVKRGNFAARMPIDQTGISGKIADVLNDIIERNEQMTTELERISTVVGKEGKINERASLGGAVRGGWRSGID